MKNGFTLFELLIVLSIAVILSGSSYFAYTKWLRWNDLQANSFVIEQALKSTRNLALAQKEPAELKLIDKTKLQIQQKFKLKQIQYLHGPISKLQWVGSGRTQERIQFDADGTTHGQQGSVRLCMKHLSEGKKIVINHAGRIYTSNFECNPN